MGIFLDGVRRVTQFIIYLIALGCSAVALGIYAYFSASLDNHNEHVTKADKAVMGISGAAALFVLIAMFLTLFFGNKGRILNAICVIFNLLCAGAFIAIAVIARHGASRCNGQVNTPLGNGPTDSTIPNYDIRYHTACRENTAVFAVAIIGIFTFLMLFLGELELRRAHLARERAELRSHDPVFTQGAAPVAARRFWRPLNRNRGAVVEKHAYVQQPTTYTTVPGTVTTHHV